MKKIENGKKNYSEINIKSKWILDENTFNDTLEKIFKEAGIDVIEEENEEEFADYEVVSSQLNEVVSSQLNEVVSSQLNEVVSSQLNEVDI